MVGTTDVQQFVRWGLRHGLMRRFLLHHARSGDIGARLMIDPALRDDPYPYYEQLRARGGLVVTGLAPTTVDHGVCTAVLRSADFGTGVRAPSELPTLARTAVRLSSGGPLSPGEPRKLPLLPPPMMSLNMCSMSDVQSL